MNTVPLIPYRQQVVSLLRLGMPIVVGQLGMIILGLADTIMIGHHSTEELAAAGFVNNVFNLAIIFATGFSYGLTPLIGMLQGNGNTRGIGRVFRNALAANAVIGVLLTAVMYVVYCFVDKMGQPEELLPHIRPYFVLQLVSLLFIMLFNAFRQFAEGLTDTRTPMWILLGGNALNILGNYLLIYGSLGFPEWGLFGAGVSTLVSRIVMLLVFVAIVACTRRYRIYRDALIHSRLNRNDFVQLNALGWPIALQMGMETAAFSLSAIMVGWLGSVSLAAHQIMISVSTIGFMVYYGRGAALAVQVSHFMGRHDFSNLRRAVHAGTFKELTWKFPGRKGKWAAEFSVGRWEKNMYFSRKTGIIKPSAGSWDGIRRSQTHPLYREYEPAKNDGNDTRRYTKIWYTFFFCEGAVG